MAYAQPTNDDFVGARLARLRGDHPERQQRARLRGRRTTTTTPTPATRSRPAATGRPRRRRLGLHLRPDARATTAPDHAVLVGQQLHAEHVPDEPAPERDAGLLLRQPVPRPPGGGADRLHRRRRATSEADGGDAGAGPGRRRRRHRGGGCPDGDHIDNANMYTPADGTAAAHADVPVHDLDRHRAVRRLERRRRRVDHLPRVHPRPLEPAGHRRVGQPGADTASRPARWARPGPTGTRWTSSSRAAPTRVEPGDCWDADLGPNAGSATCGSARASPAARPWVRTQPIDCLVNDGGGISPIAGESTAGLPGRRQRPRRRLHLRRLRQDHRRARGARRRRDLGRDAVADPPGDRPGRATRSPRTSSPAASSCRRRSRPSWTPATRSCRPTRCCTAAPTPPSCGRCSRSAGWATRRPPPERTTRRRTPTSNPAAAAARRRRRRRRRRPRPVDVVAVAGRPPARPVRLRRRLRRSTRRRRRCPRRRSRTRA